MAHSPEVVLSPILVRPIREQLEHDKIIRLLQAKYKRKFDAGMNVGLERVVPIGSGTSALFPDVVLLSTERGKKLMGVVEVETSESVNHLEALSEWVPFSKLRAPFYLYVPAGSIDTTRRLCADHPINVTEIWTYHPVGDQIRFTLIVRPPAPKVTPKAAAARAAVLRPPRPAAGARLSKPAVPARARTARATKGAPARVRAKKTPAKPARAQKRK